jgi:hypothetical protein
MLDRKSLREGDEVWIAHGYCNNSEPSGHVYGGTVVAADAEGGFVYRTAEGRVDSCPWWSSAAVAATEAEAWGMVADSLATIASKVAKLAVECRSKAAVEVVA